NFSLQELFADSLEVPFFTETPGVSNIELTLDALNSLDMFDNQCSLYKISITNTIMKKETVRMQSYKLSYYTTLTYFFTQDELMPNYSRLFLLAPSCVL
ncbi:hypothetical protein ACJX0J_016485, partial [Zea mays]